MCTDPLTLTDGTSERELLVRSDPAALGLTLRRSAAAKLTSRHVERLALEINKKSKMEERFTRELPGVDPAACEELDEGGVIAEGALVSPGDVLVGRVRASVSSFELSPEEKRLRGLRGDGPEGKDTSLRCPPHLKGTVTSVSRTATRVEVEITEERPARVGDVLELGGRRAVVAAVVDRQAAEILWPFEALGRSAVRKVACAEDRLEARSIGPYSIVTQQPLGGKASFGGQLLSEAQLYALEARGARHLAREMLTVKSDDVTGRVRLFESIVLGKPRCEASLPESASVLLRELESLAFEVTTKEAEPEPKPLEPPEPEGGIGDIFRFFETPRPDRRVEALRISLSGSQALRARSRGRVTKPETINYRTFRPEQEGLFCQRIFGPVRDYECACGRYKGMKHRGVTCERCGVEVTQSKVRRERFGHVELPTWLLHPWAFEAVAELLGRPAEQIEQILKEQLTLALEEPEGREEAGASALRGALAEVDLDRAAPGSIAAVMRRSGLRPEDLFYDAWPVLPPDLRPLVPLDGGRWATSDLNDLYRRLINRSNRLRRLLELDAPEIILRNERRQLQEALESLVQNGLRGKTVAGPDKRPLRSIADMIGGPRGRLRGSLRGKRVDYSGAATVVPAALAPREVLLPRSMALELFKPWIYSQLEAVGEVTTIKAAKALVHVGAPVALAALDEVVRDHPVVLFPDRGEAPPPTVVAGFDVRLWDEPALGLSQVAMERLGLVEPAAVQVHLPVDPEAIREARGLDLPAEPLFPQDDAFHHRLLRCFVVREVDCGGEARDVASCRARGAPCAACSGQPLGAAVGLLAADRLEAMEIHPDHAALLQRQRPEPSWLARATFASDVGPVLFEAALAGERDPLEDPTTRSLLGLISFEPS